MELDTTINLMTKAIHPLLCVNEQEGNLYTISVFIYNHWKEVWRGHKETLEYFSSENMKVVQYVNRVLVNIQNNLTETYGDWESVLWEDVELQFGVAPDDRPVFRLSGNADLLIEFTETYLNKLKLPITSDTYDELSHNLYDQKSIVFIVNDVHQRKAFTEVYHQFAIQEIDDDGF